ncbi:non-hydrolyzing UDP-N-acetylglucosamine 2-epimerase [Winogradskyella sp. A3E31]|uniref:non-hydrolyzing UDP-N-acetylglucosamine 2-epimerase n=1 Tax=Winogradskyella sp. A3E31 TaxID=3349637 RepID=UPI00398A7D1C
MYRITIVAGARPNFMKIAPIIHEIERLEQNGVQIDYRLVHTGQHYDKNMSGSFFEQLEIPDPHINLECSGNSQAEQTAAIMIAFEKDLIEHPSNLVMVVGDVTSTMACAIVAKKMHTKVAHVEGGIRSGDINMPEEVNRIITDSITDYFFTTSKKANENLEQQGMGEEQLFLVGNTMIDTLLKQQPNFIKPPCWDSIGLKNQNYFVLTMHRPANVDAQEKLQELLKEIIVQTRELPIIFPAHPRTVKMLSKLHIEDERLHIVKPLSYLEFNYLVEHAKAVITDSGGITEEASVLNVPCITLRNNTERPETISLGTNILAGTQPENLKPLFDRLFEGNWKKGRKIPLWDGQTAERLLKALLEAEGVSEA